MLSESTDIPRFRSIINEAIDSGDVESTPAWSNTSNMNVFDENDVPEYVIEDDNDDDKDNNNNSSSSSSNNKNKKSTNTTTTKKKASKAKTTATKTTKKKTSSSNNNSDENDLASLIKARGEKSGNSFFGPEWTF